MGTHEHKTQNEILTFGAGSILQVEPGAAAPGLIRSVSEPPSGFVLAQGEVTLDGSNPDLGDDRPHGHRVGQCRAEAGHHPGDDPVALTVDYGGAVPAGRLDIYAWKTDGSDPTLIASTNSSAVISWTCVGT